MARKDQELAKKNQEVARMADEVTHLEEVVKAQDAPPLDVEDFLDGSDGVEAPFGEPSVFAEAPYAVLDAIEKEALRLRVHFSSGTLDLFTIDGPVLIAVVEILSLLQKPIMCNACKCWVTGGGPYLVACENRRHCDWNLRLSRFMKPPLGDTCTTCGRPTQGPKGTMLCNTVHAPVALEGDLAENVLARAFLQCIEIVEHLSGLQFKNLVTVGKDRKQYLFFDPRSLEPPRRGPVL